MKVDIHPENTPASEIPRRTRRAARPAKFCTANGEARLWCVDIGSDLPT